MTNLELHNLTLVIDNDPDMTEGIIDAIDSLSQRGLLYTDTADKELSDLLLSWARLGILPRSIDLAYISLSELLSYYLIKIRDEFLTKT